MYPRDSISSLGHCAKENKGVNPCVLKMSLNNESSLLSFLGTNLLPSDHEHLQRSQCHAVLAPVGKLAKQLRNQ